MEVQVHVLSDACGRAIKRRVCLATRNPSEITHAMINRTLRFAAAATESPSPVQSAMYAARHAGHFGISARIALGRIQPTRSTARRTLDSQPLRLPLQNFSDFAFIVDLPRLIDRLRSGHFPPALFFRDVAKHVGMDVQSDIGQVVEVLARHQPDELADFALGIMAGE